MCNHASRTLKDDISYREACISIIKCSIGAGSFSLPFAFMNGGFTFSFFLILIIGFVSATTTKLLVKVQHIFYENHDIDLLIDGEKRKLPNYRELGALAFPKICFRFYSHKMNIVQLIIKWGTILTCIGVCSAYIDFISETIPQVCNVFYSSYFCQYIQKNYIPWYIFPVVFALSAIKSYKSLTIISFIGNFAVLSGFLCVLFYGAYHLNSSIVYTSSSNDTFKSLGIISFLFSVQIVIIPILENVKDVTQRLLIINDSFFIITCFNAIFGVAGYLLFSTSLCYGEKGDIHLGPCSNILSNINSSGSIVLVKILICIDLFASIPLVLSACKGIIFEDIYLILDFVRRSFQQSQYTDLGKESSFGKLEIELQSMECVTPSVSSEHESSIQELVPDDLSQRYPYIEIFVLLILCLVTTMVSIYLSSFVNAVSLVGGIVCSLTGFVIPPIIYIKVCGLRNLSWYSILSYCFISIFGCVLIIISILS